MYITCTYSGSLLVKVYCGTVKRIESAGNSCSLAEPHHGAITILDPLERPIALAITARENLDINNLSGTRGTRKPDSNPRTTLRKWVGNGTGQSGGRNRSVRKSYEAAEKKRKNDKKERNSEDWEEQKLRFILFLDLGNKGKRVFSQKNLRVKVLSISFEEIWDLLDLVYDKSPNVTFARYKLLNRKQRDSESFEQFWGALTDLASKCNNRDSDEAEWIRDVFICNMRKIETQQKLLSATISPSEALNQAQETTKKNTYTIRS